jgi:hypothetical protein
MEWEAGGEKKCEKIRGKEMSLVIIHTHDSLLLYSFSLSHLESRGGKAEVAEKRMANKT